MTNRWLSHKLILAILCLALLVNTGCRRGSSSPPAASGASASSGLPTPTGLDGTWKATAVMINGHTMPTEALGAMTSLEISGTKITCKFQGIDAAEGTLHLDPSQQPKAIDIKLTMLRGRVGGKSIAGQSVEMRGIYDLSGNTLKLCYFPAESNAARQGQRPKVFQSLPQSGEELITYERVR
jgi:uncharacterized protein (TIGR03067 family)